jgi:hypothetical protein
MPDPVPAQNVREALEAIIEGKVVKRIRHELTHDGNDLSGLFLEELTKYGYSAATVASVDVKPGERVPAFFIESGIAWFGWVFWEQFTSWKLRKLWGSVAKNKMGDWEIQLSANRPATIFANMGMKLEMDIEHPPEF